MMKNAINFMLKAVFVRLFDYAGKWLDKQAKINFKTDWKQVITIHMLPSISRSKGKQAMIFAELARYKI